MKEKYVNLVFVIDESGSMMNSVEQVTEGFKTMVDEQKATEDGECTVSVFRFQTNVTCEFIGKNVNDIDSKLKYQPGGMTALYDGVGTAIDKVGKWLSDMDEADRPSQTVVIIMTDGAENCSSEYKLSQMKEKIQHQTEKYNWKFVYVGMDVTNIEDAKDLGIHITTAVDKNNIHTAYRTFSKMSSKMRKAATTLDYCSALMELEQDCAELKSDYEISNNLKL